MASASSVSRLVVIIILINVGAISDTTVLVIASAAGLLSSPIQLEREAILGTGWWVNNWATANYTSYHYKWTGISCNSAGSVTGVSLLWYENDNINGELGRFNFSCFPNLKSFKIHSNYLLSGSIPSEIAVVSMLQTLELPSNNLTGKYLSLTLSLSLYVILYFFVAMRIVNTDLVFHKSHAQQELSLYRWGD